MSLRPSFACVLFLCAGALPALAIDPFVYRESLARCQSFKDRACCHETASYEACIADKIKTSFGHGTKYDGMRLDQIDPGAWSGAMAACQSWISILRECAPPAGTPDATLRTPARIPTPVPTPAVEGNVVLRRVDPPVVDATDANWTTVQSGLILNKGHQYLGRYTWDEPPAVITDRGFPLALRVKAETEGQQRLSTGIGVSGDFDFVKSPADLGQAATEFPAYSESGRAQEGGGTVHVMPRKTYPPNAKVKLKIGAFWGRSVTYVYQPASR